MLDIGTGTGIWAIEMADEFPGAVVYGTDLSPIQPSFVPSNVKFYVDDFESDWSFPEIGTFDLIHWRSIAGSTNNWAKLYGQCYKNLKPGGWIEIHEYDGWVYSDDDPELEKAPWIKDWCMTLDKATTAFGKQINVAMKQKGWMKEAGFEEIVEKVVKVR